MLSSPLRSPLSSPAHGVFGRGSSYPRALALLWPSRLTSSGVLKSAVGPAPTYTDTPTVDADGVTPGDGPAFVDVVTWSDGGTRVWEITMSTAAADLVGDVAVGGGLSVSSAGLKFSDVTNVATVATSWAAGEVVTAVVQVDGDVMRVGRMETEAQQLWPSGAPRDMQSIGDLIWDMSETSPAWGLSSIDAGEEGEFVTTTLGGIYGRFARLKPAALGVSNHADIFRGVIGSTPVDFPLFSADDTFTLAVYMSSFSGSDISNSNSGSSTPYIDVRFSSAAGMERGGLFRTMRKNGWQFLTLRAADFTVVSGGEVITNPMKRVYIRTFTNATTGGAAEFYIGPMWRNRKARPKLILELDDGWLSTYTQAFPYCLTRDVRLSIPTAAETIGTNDDVYCNWSQIEEMAAAGFEFIVHSNENHTEDNTTYQQVYDDTVEKIGILAAHGIYSQHYVYPQGKFNSEYSFDALLDAGIVTAAHTTGGSNLATSEGVTIPLMLPRSTMNNTIGSAAVIVAIDKAISLGTTLRLYGHQVLGPLESVTNSDLQLTYAQFTAIIDAAATRRDDGLLDIVTVEEWWTNSVHFDSTLPALTLSPDCPGKLKQVQEWRKVATSREIGKY